MKKLISGIIFVCLSIPAVGLAADGTIAPQKSVQSAQGEKPAGEKLGKVPPNTNCITETGSRLKAKDKSGCNGLPGRAYDKEDLDRTGATSVAEALQRLDPSVQVGR